MASLGRRPRTPHLRRAMRFSRRPPPFSRSPKRPTRACAHHFCYGGASQHRLFLRVWAFRKPKIACVPPEIASLTLAQQLRWAYYETAKARDVLRASLTVRRRDPRTVPLRFDRLIAGLEMLRDAAAELDSWDPASNPSPALANLQADALLLLDKVAAPLAFAVAHRLHDSDVMDIAQATRWARHASSQRPMPKWLQGRDPVRALADLQSALAAWAQRAVPRKYAAPLPLSRPNASAQKTALEQRNDEGSSQGNIQAFRRPAVDSVSSI